MCDGIVIDGHMLQEIRNGLVKESGFAYEIISWVMQNCGIAMTDYIEAHWRNHCSARDFFFWDWYTDQVKNHVIHFIEPGVINDGIWRKIHNDYGLPRNPFTRAYIECAHGTKEPRYILTEDMDLHDPRARRNHTQTQVVVKESRSGSLCRYLERQLGIRVGTATDCREYFAIDKGSCPCKKAINLKQCPHVSKPL